jgi:hypothetical protein
VRQGAPDEEERMAFREVAMVEVREMLRQYLAGVGKKRVAERLGCDAKTVRAYVGAAEQLGLRRGQGEDALTEALLAAVIGAVRPKRQQSRGDGWALCEQHRAFLEADRSFKRDLAKRPVT